MIIPIYLPKECTEIKQIILIYCRSHPYRSVAQLNPFSDKIQTRNTQLSHFYDHRANSAQSNPLVREMPATKSFPTPKGMSQSRSENNLHYRSPPSRIQPPLPRSATNYEIRQMMNDGVSSPDKSPIRGRRANRTPSPTKLDNIKEDQLMDFTPSPPKRSRSPMKQLFGEHGWLGRSTSMKELPSEEYRKTGIKHWGERIKQRVGGMVSVSSCPQQSSAF